MPLMKNLFCSFWILLIFLQCQPNNDHSTQFQTSNGYRYETVTNDPTNTRIYTLDNGLKVYLSRYENSPQYGEVVELELEDLFDY